MPFILSKSICQRNEQLLGNFLGEVVCRPKKEGDLGIERLIDWNQAAMHQHLRAIVSKQSSLWVQWSYKHINKSNCFWVMKMRLDCSWIWTKLFNLRYAARPLVTSIIGDGSSISSWYDNWASFYSLF